MRRLFDIVASGFRMALTELWKNKLRTFLSLFGITIGIFCIIGVLSAVQSLEHNLQQEIKALGTNTIYLDKWEYSGGDGQYPWWKYVKRPEPKFEEINEIMERTPSADAAAFKIEATDAIEYGDNVMSGIQIFGLSETFHQIQPVEIGHGRYLIADDFGRGSPSAVVGNNIAEKLFGEAERALGKIIDTRGKKLVIVGVAKKQGRGLLGAGWQFDDAVITSYRFARGVMEEKNSQPLILVKGKEGLPVAELKDELRGAMRSIHKLSPTAEDDFSLNDINEFSDQLSQAFVSVNIGGWIIAALALIVGMFGVANIMFVTVKERTSQIGLKKALGAKQNVILIEFLLESAALCLIGGAMGILLVYLCAAVVSALGFALFIPGSLLLIAVFICIAVGLLAGIIPARQAARMDPVVAIRSK